MEILMSMLLMGKFPILLTYIVTYFLSTVAMYVKILFCFSPSTGGLIFRSVLITFNYLFNLSCVVLIPFCCSFIRPLSVTTELSGIYFLTAISVRPGHVANWLFRIALTSVRLSEQKIH